MPSPDSHTGLRLARVILWQEVRGLLQAPALWIMLIIVSLLVGYSFVQAVRLFSQASQTALSFPELAAGMDPIQGIFVPTLGAYYLAETLLLPFVAIRLIALDKRNGTIKLLVQLPLSSTALCGLKMLAMAGVWLLGFLPALAAIGFWLHLGGHIHAPAILLLLAGHALYSLTIIAIAMFAAAIADSPPTAAMICLAVTLGSWVLDFAAANQGAFAEKLAFLSLTGMLHAFETGLLSTPRAATFLCLAIAFFFLAVVHLHPGRGLPGRIVRSAAVLILCAIVPLAAFLHPMSWDLTENRVHSFPATDAEALRRLDKPLVLTIHLSPADSRFIDLKNDMLAKLRRTVPTLEIRLAADKKKRGLFDAEASDKYGLIEVDYDGRHEESYSNSPEEMLPIIYNLAGISPPAAAAAPALGHPLVADASGCRPIFMVLFPLLYAFAGLCGWKGFPPISFRRPAVPMNKPEHGERQ